MANETAGFREMGLSTDMGKNMRGSISGVATSKAVSTDVNRDKSSLTTYGLHGKGSKGRHSKRSGKKRK